MQMDKSPVLSDIGKYMQYNQHPIGHYGLGIKAPEQRYTNKMYKRSQDGVSEVKEISLMQITETELARPI